MVREMSKRLWMYGPTTIKALNLGGDERPPTHRAHDFSRGIPMWHFSANDIQPVCYNCQSRSQFLACISVIFGLIVTL